eukprot:COSAG01_NODE_61615_length_288_cov_1.640212_1_plen_36_part_10
MAAMRRAVRGLLLLARGRVIAGVHCQECSSAPPEYR